jgi:hypothetical protein
MAVKASARDASRKRASKKSAQHPLPHGYVGDDVVEGPYRKQVVDPPTGGAPSR